MKNLIIIILVIITGVLAYMQFSNNSNVQKDENKINYGFIKPGLIYKSEEWEMKLPNGNVASKEITKVPYVVYSDGEYKVFQEAAGLRIDIDLISPLGNYIYFSKGNGKDASIIPYIFDVNNRTLHKVCLQGSTSGECNDPYSGFSSQDSVTVSWEEDSRLKIVYQNNSLVPGVSDSGPVIGEQVFESINSNQPWITGQVY